MEVEVLNAALDKIVELTNERDALKARCGELEAALREARGWLDDSNGNDELIATIKRVDAVLDQQTNSQKK